MNATHRKDSTDPPSYDAWTAAGERLAIRGHHVFVRRGGLSDAAHGHHLTLLHGFPTHSWDWGKIWQRLALERRLLTMDLLGFGESDKPSLSYSFGDHADRLEALWDREGIEETTLVAHDYSATLALELLARRIEAPTGGVRIRRVVLLNGGVRGELHRPRPIQRILVSPLGPLVARLMSRRIFGRSFSAVFSHAPTEAELDDFWRGITARRGHLRVPSLLHYLADRRANAARWEGALNGTDIPLHFVWGLHDPVSGAHVLDEVKHLGASVHALDAGHYPQWEAPAETAAAILEATA